ncbi:MAG: chromosome partitioning protein ParB [Robiginitomaculum sp.]|nr:MAG: chromosome partitioning protein ParB [Robiginitomaculum sp.]
MTTDPSDKSKVFIAFGEELITLKLEQIIPVKIINKGIQNGAKFKQIQSSVKEVGIIEPLVVKPEGKSKKKYILLDGHIRLFALKNIGATQVNCIESTDDETFTYNKYINRLAPVQQNRMIIRAVKRGVSEEKIAKALNLNVQSIITKRNLLNGICPEVIESLKDRMIAMAVFSTLRQMKDFRQIEAVALMEDAGIYTVAHAKALLAATPKEQLRKPDKPKNIKGLSAEQMARMETEMKNLQREYQLIEETYGTDVLTHTLIKRYLSTLLQNTNIHKYLTKYHDEMLSALQSIAQEP